MSPDIEFKMLHSDKFLIDIDNSSSESDMIDEDESLNGNPDISP